MSNKPIFVATHPRSCSTAFERVFMTRQDTLTCVHEPFGDAFYFGPERLSARYENDEKARQESGFADSTFKTVFDKLEREGSKGKRIFIKDMIYYLVPPEGKPAAIAPSLGGNIRKGAETDGFTATSNGEANSTENSVTKDITNGTTNEVPNGTTNTTNGTTGNTSTAQLPHPYSYNTHPEPQNPTVVPTAILAKFHFTFLIRHPRRSIPSYFRCTIPPLSFTTGFHQFLPSEAGYDELRRVFDYLRAQRLVGPSISGRASTSSAASSSTPQGNGSEIAITVIDADDLLDDPHGIIEAYCQEVGIEYDPGMLIWDDEVDQERAKEAFEKWRGFHEDAIDSTSLKPRSQAHKNKTTKIQSEDAEDAEWREKYGNEGQRVIRACVDRNVADYEYLKGFALQGVGVRE